MDLGVSFSAALQQALDREGPRLTFARLVARTEGGSLHEPDLRARTKTWANRLRNWERGTSIPRSVKDLQSVTRHLEDAAAKRIEELYARTHGAKLRGRYSNSSNSARIGDLDPIVLGVKRCALAGSKETSLPAYVSRPHDQVLIDLIEKSRRDHLPRLLLMVGGSCSGKSRAAFEALAAAAPDWPVETPRNASELLELLSDSPGEDGQIVWLDEFQRYVTGDAAAVVRRLDDVLQFKESTRLFIGTLWLTVFDALRDRSLTSDMELGHQVRSLLANSRVHPIAVPDIFDAESIQRATAAEDARLRLAASVAQAGRITQTLAGGEQLLYRIADPPQGQAYAPFSEAARGMIYAACELRRIGLENPVPSAVITSACIGYVKSDVAARLGPDWIADALAEASVAWTTSTDYSIQGVPALTRVWLDHSTREPSHYEVHEYLLQYWTNRAEGTRTPFPVWQAISEALDVSSTGQRSLHVLVSGAERRGLYPLAVRLARGNGGGSRLPAALALQGSRSSLRELRELADSSYHASVALCSQLTRQGSVESLRELCERAWGKADIQANQEIRNVLLSRFESDPVRSNLLMVMEEGWGTVSQETMRRAVREGHSIARWFHAKTLAASATRDAGALRELRSRAIQEDYLSGLVFASFLVRERPPDWEHDLMYLAKTQAAPGRILLRMLALEGATDDLLEMNHSVGIWEDAENYLTTAVLGEQTPIESVEYAQSLGVPDDRILMRLIRYGTSLPRSAELDEVIGLAESSISCLVLAADPMFASMEDERLSVDYALKPRVRTTVTALTEMGSGRWSGVARWASFRLRVESMGGNEEATEHYVSMLSRNDSVPSREELRSLALVGHRTAAQALVDAWRRLHPHREVIGLDGGGDPVFEE